LEDEQKCRECNERGRALLAENKAREAYAELRKGMLGTEESYYSRLLSSHFKRNLERFCTQRNIDEYEDKVNYYVEEIRKVLLLPDYVSLTKALSDLVREAKEAGNRSEAIRFQKELMFFIILQGDFDGELEKRISDNMQELCRVTGWDQW
jgi:hypothetical protein